ncbi:hypothetical protein D9613_000127 [Agrocybe pediades]|uniref:Uncharacterized protein n=1 Tax=Agrocybe pediades TaxID=84607 RepID=A0A8H4VSL2_9AGAR|nr:hypothetical protein D9613_000127 [Agrocybe pediades]
MASDSNSLVIDDNDIRVKYTGNWEVVKDSKQWLETSHSTWDFDASASISFNGTGVRVYGTVPIGTGTSVTDYSLSHSSKSSSSPAGTSSIRVWQKSGKEPIYSKEFWYSGPLEYGQYSLTIKNKGEDNDQDFQLDRFVIETGEGNASSPSSSTQSSSSSLSGSLTQETGLPSAGSTEGNGTVLSSTETSKSSIVPKVVGPIVAVAVVAILLLCWLLFRRRKAHKTAAKGEIPVNPFVLGANQTGSTNTYPGTTAQMSTSPTSASGSSPTIQTPRYGAEKSAYSLASRSRANTYEGGLSPTSEGGAPSVTAVSTTTGSGGSPGSPVRLGGANRRETVGTSAMLDELGADPPPSYQPPNSTTI